MQLIPCPQCQTLLRLSKQVSERAHLQCPICQIEINFGELLLAAPAWTVLHDPGEAFATTAATGDLAGVAVTSPDTGDDPTEEPEYELAAESAASGPKADLTRKSPIRKGDWSNFKPITHEEFQRRKRAQRSPIWSFLQIILGGLAAIPVSMLLIWHLLGKDPFEVGPVVAKYAPWIVPKQFHPLEDEEIEFSTPWETPTPLNPPDRKSSISSGIGRDFDSELNNKSSTRSSENPTSAEGLDKPSAKPTNPPKVSSADTTPESTDGSQTPPTQAEPEPGSAPKPDSSKSEPEQPKSSTTSPPAAPVGQFNEGEPAAESTADRSSTPTAPPAPGVTDATLPPAATESTAITADSSPLGAALQSANQAIADWESNTESDLDVRRRLAKGFFDSLCNASTTFGSSDMPEASLRTWSDQLNRLSEKVASSGTLRQLVISGFRAKLGTSTASDGVVMICQIDAPTESSGDIVLCQIMPPPGIVGQSYAWKLQATPRLRSKIVSSGQYLVFAYINPQKGEANAATVEDGKLLAVELIP